jgi:hypothetical protein
MQNKIALVPEDSLNNMNVPDTNVQANPLSVVHGSSCLSPFSNYWTRFCDARSQQPIPYEKEIVIRPETWPIKADRIPLAGSASRH